MFLFLVSHGARHGWSRLRWLDDINKMVGLGLDWKAIKKLVKQHNNSHILGQSMVLTSQLLKTKFSYDNQKFFMSERAKTLAQEAVFYMNNMVNLHDDPLSKEVSFYHRRHLYSLMSSKQKVLFILSYLYPYHIDKVTLPLPKCLHFLYFLLRPFLCLWRKARKQSVLY